MGSRGGVQQSKNRRMAGQQTFREWLADQHYSPRSVTLYGHYVTRADIYLRNHDRSLNRAKPVDLRNWWSTLPTSSSSRNGARHALIAWYRYRGQRDGGPARFIDRIPAEHGLPRPVNELDREQLRAAALNMGGIHAPFVWLLTSTGCRMGEAMRARWSQFDLRAATWTIEGKGSRRRGPKLRVVPLSPTLVEILQTWRRESCSADWLFASDRSRTGHLGQCTLQKRLTEACEEAGIDRATAHRWRHTYATIGMRKTGNPMKMQKMLGHASPATLQVYTLLDVEDLQELVDTMG